MPKPANASDSRRIFTRQDEPALREAVAAIVAETPVTDLHTHLYAQEFGGLLLYGVDELLTYHYLIAELLRATRMSYEHFWDLDKKAQADLIWQELFVKRSPYSEACRGVLTALDALGLDTGARDLEGYRRYFQEQDLEGHLKNVFDVAKVTSVVMTNDPFDETERPVWEGSFQSGGRFHAALRIDPLLNNWPDVVDRLRGWDYNVNQDLSAKTIGEVRRFLSDWLTRMKALYMAVSLPPNFGFPKDTTRSKLIAEAIMPVAREHDVPFAMMIGVKRNVNASLRLAGDGVGSGDVGAVEALCATYPHNKFMVTMLARENQHALCVAARKFPNLLLFGCWWFLNNPSLIEEMTRMRFELLGTSVVPQHSDARVLEQVIYKWAHSREIIGKVLGDKYVDLARTGWHIEESEIRRDVAKLLGGNFWDFLK